MAAPTRSKRLLWIGLGFATVMAAALVWLAALMLDRESLKARIVDAVTRASGRTLVISGPIGIKFSLAPTITLEDVSFPNPPGFSRPEMATAARVEVSLALYPLLRRRLEVSHITLARPDIMLETDREGRGNWVFTRDTPPAPATAAPPAGATTANAFTVSISDVRIEDARLGWIDGVTGRRTAAEVRHLAIVSPDGAPTRLTGAIVFAGQPFALSGASGPIEQLRGATDTSPWPLALKLEGAGITLTAEGRIAHPLLGRGYHFTLDGTLPDSAALLPNQRLPSLKAISAHAEVRDGGSAMPVIAALEIKAGSADLGSWLRGARLEDLILSARDAQPLRFQSKLAMAGTKGDIEGTAGDLAWLMKGASDPVEVGLQWKSSSAQASVKGRIQAPRRLTGIALDVAAEVPEPALVMGGAPPGLKAVVLHTRLTDAPGPMPFRLDSNAGDLAGELTVSLRPRPSFAGTVSSRRLDLDALLTAAKPPAAAPETPAQSPAAPEVPARREPGPLIPDTKLPFDVLRAADAGLKLKLDSVRLGGADITGIDAVLSLKNGLLRVDPFTITQPDQGLTGLLEADASKSPPSIHVAVKAPGLALPPLLAALRLPAAASGKAEVQADLSGAGESPRAIAASLEGWAGIAIQDGQLDAALINQMLEHLRPLRIDGARFTDLRCAAVRADAKAGIVTIQPMALNTAALIVEGGGEADLGRETMSLRVRSRTRIGGTGIALPVRVTGSWRSPRASVDISAGAARDRMAGLLLGGKDIMGAAGGGDPCIAALARARDMTAPADITTPETSPEVGSAGSPAVLGPRSPIPPGAAVDMLRRLLTKPEGQK